MTSAKVIALVLLICATSHTQADITISNLLDSIRAVPSGEIDEETVNLVQSSYETASSPQLFYMAMVESSRGNDASSIKHLLAGQVRSLVDLTLFEPSSDADKETAAHLYGMIFYMFGGAGKDEYYQDENVYTTILSDLQSYNPKVSNDYNPGWSSDSIVTAGDYELRAKEVISSRVAQLEGVIALMQNEEYAALSKELKALQDRAPRAFQAGTEDGDRAAEVMRRMREIGGAPSMPEIGQ